MLSTDRQTNQHYQKHNLLCQGGNNDKTDTCIIKPGVTYLEQCGAFTLHAQVKACCEQSGVTYLEQNLGLTLLVEPCCEQCQQSVSHVTSSVCLCVFPTWICHNIQTSHGKRRRSSSHCSFSLKQSMHSETMCN